jgi:cyclophilin family peptidyl-prolyl cis-trans isomerase
MAFTLGNWVKRVFLHRNKVATPVRLGDQAVETLEQRLLMAAGPRVVGIAADNRGEVVLSMDRALNPATVTARSVQLRYLSHGRYRVYPATVTYDAKHKQIIASTPLKADTSYQIYLVSKYLRGADGTRLDGEFNGAGKASGNGRAGGDLVAMTQVASQPIARFSTVCGNIDVRLFATQTPLTVRNFLAYANATGDDTKYSWDNTFIHRNVSGMLVGGGYKVDAKNALAIIWQRPAIPNEAFPNNPGNIRGTIGMYKLGGVANSATNQWYFNVTDNRATLDALNGGYAVFGQITSDAGLKVMDKIAALKTYNIDPTSQGTPFSQTPVINGDAVIARGKLSPKKDLVVVRRVAIQMDVVSPTAASPVKAKALQHA